jgi:hypothetical protein|tara:strand:+ start:2094 stop:2786 length:693 start_codon:yes stop_codon:yes gene_type:complete
MSSYVDREWFYYLRGRELLLYKLLGGSSSERITQAGVFKTQQNELMYPDEDIADGLRIEYTALNEPFVSEALETTTVVASGTGIEFVDAGGSADRITDTASGLGDFIVGDKIRVQGSASNDGDYTITVDGGTGSISVATGSLTAEATGERVTITQIPVEDTSPDETSHPNLNRMLSLALVDYLKAMEADKRGDIERKEYYIKEFYGKLGDNESNKRKISMSFPIGPFAVR